MNIHKSNYLQPTNKHDNLKHFHVETITEIWALGKMFKLRKYLVTINKVYLDRCKLVQSHDKKEEVNGRTNMPALDVSTFH